MRLYRLCRAAHRALDGEGARLYGGRWNTSGVAVVYTSTSLSLAALEYLAHVNPDDVPGDLVAITLEVPDDASGIERVQASELPAGWERLGENPTCASLGDAWARAGRTLALRVPSAVVPEETNVLLNPRHADAAQVRVIAERPFAFDPRLVP